MPTPEYQAGGMAPVEGERIASGITDLFGRVFNNLNGTTANNMFNAEEAEKARQFNAAEAEKSRLFNSSEAQKARDFEQYMSNTAYQRAVSDMKKAGINPASLSGVFSSGSGASTGSGVSASSGSPATSSHASATSGKGSGIIGTLLRLAIGIAMLS